MTSTLESTTGRGFREQIRFYLVDHRTPIGRGIDIGLLGFNLLFVAIFVVETYPVSPSVRSRLWQLEVGIALLFLVEYLLRIYGAQRRVSEVFDPYTMVDLIAILPTLAILVLPIPAAAVNIGFLRVVRVVRVLRFYRFTREQDFFFGTVELATLRAMKLLLTVLVLLFVTAGLFYSVEHVQNPAVSNFGDAFYFVVVTLSTVGFGDILPVTQAGRWVTVAAILVGIVLIPYQASKIIRTWTLSDKIQVTCPNCGLTGHDPDASHCKDCGNVIYQPADASE